MRGLLPPSARAAFLPARLGQKNMVMTMVMIMVIKAKAVIKAKVAIKAQVLMAGDMAGGAAREEVTAPWAAAAPSSMRC
ncbi:MAG: hypothetical protein C0605_03110 [Hyphomicrobiales bacterium]|nr:MAG: hypothetical protein C0605_03110 [Hyphomicrobiales bacterium]